MEDLQNKEEIMQRQLQSLDRKHQITLLKLRNDIEEAQQNSREVEAKLREKEKVSINIIVSNPFRKFLTLIKKSSI